MADIHITSIADLLNFGRGNSGYGTSSEYLNVYLDNDLDFATDDDGAYANVNWEGCIGAFFCNFYGQNHKIKNISYTGVNNWGFFQGSISSPSIINISNLTLEDINILTSGSYVGSFISSVYVAATSGTHILSNCHASGSIESSSYAGGLVGNWETKYYLNAINCTFTGTIKSTNAAGVVGRLVGSSSSIDGSIIISNCGVKADIIGTSTAFGLQGPYLNAGGYGSAPTIQRYYFIGSFKGTPSNIYGLCGRHSTYYSESYIVVDEANTTVTLNSNNIIYDNDVATENSITVSGGTSETTAHLKNGSYMHETYNWSY